MQEKGMSETVQTYLLRSREDNGVQRLLYKEGRASLPLVEAVLEIIMLTKMLKVFVCVYIPIIIETPTP